MMAFGIVNVQIQVFLTSKVVAGERSLSNLAALTMGDKAASTHWIGGWVGPRACLVKILTNESS
jgi:hypothetical protein